MSQQEFQLSASKYGLAVSWDRGSTAVDIDLQAVVVNDKGTIIDAVYYNNMKAMKAITHSGDERTGDKTGLDEVIWVTLTKLPEHVKLILFVIAAHSGGHLRSAKNGRLHVLEQVKDSEVASFAMEESEFDVDAVAMMVRSEGGTWSMRIVQEPAQEGQHFIDILEPTLGNLIRSQIPGAPARQKVAFAMEKGTVVDLPETGALGQIFAGLGWDIANGKDIDLDVSAVCFTGAARCLGAVFFGNLAEYGLNHSGDNLTGEGDGDDEVITASLEAIPEEVQQIFFVINIYSNGVSFEEVSNAYCRIFDRTGSELARYVLREGKGKRGLTIARLFREPGGRWGFQAIGQFCRGKTWKDAIEDLVPLVGTSARELQLRGASTVNLGSFAPEMTAGAAAASTVGAAQPPPQRPAGKSSACAVS